MKHKEIKTVKRFVIYYTKKQLLLVVLFILVFSQLYPFLFVQKDLRKYSEQEKEYIEQAIKSIKRQNILISVVKINSFTFLTPGIPLRECSEIVWTRQGDVSHGEVRGNCAVYSADFTTFTLGIPSWVRVELSADGNQVIYMSRASHSKEIHPEM